MLYDRYPILEFDPDPTAKIMASNHDGIRLAQRCVITFFREAIQAIVEENHLQPLCHLHTESLDVPVYEYNLDGEPICLTMPSVIMAPGAVSTIEALRARGCSKFLVCGGAGSLKEGVTVGKLILPYAAVRDEGASYHYLPPSREAVCNPEALEKIRSELTRRGVPYLEGKTWTTDAFFRETAGKVRRRIEEGCITVEMEAAAFFAVAQFYGLELVQLLYAGDDLSGETWDSRDWNQQTDIRRALLELSLDLVRIL